MKFFKFKDKSIHEVVDFVITIMGFTVLLTAMAGALFVGVLIVKGS